MPYSKDTPFNGFKKNFLPKNGDLFIFPSHLLHAVDKNKIEKERHCLAFNVFIRGTLGSDDNSNRIDFK
jgi:ectoine hydroxylase-related dioxygenase (phytanoyl-CoA dioxygenase family)